MKWLRRMLIALAGVVAISILAVLAPVLYIETACRGGDVVAANDAPLLPPEHRRSEARTLLTYPEWHIVHAYDDYARVIARDPPHGYGFLRAVGQFWSSFCTLSRLAPAHGGGTSETRRTIHVIGVSFTVEMVFKALYEETVGRIAYSIGGRGFLDDLAADQAAAYADFLRQVPWYRWDFPAMIADLDVKASDGVRDRERRFSLGIEYRIKAAYADAIAGAVAATGSDALTLHSVVTGAAPDVLARIEGVTVIGPRGGGVEIETPRYAAFTDLLPALAQAGATFMEIAGNDEIMVTITSPEAMPGAILAMPRQGYGDVRSLVLVPVRDLLARFGAGQTGVEHVHDY